MDAGVEEGVDCDCETGTGKPTLDSAEEEEALDNLLPRDDRLTGAERDLGSVGGLVGEECGELTGEACGVLAGEDWVELAVDGHGEAGRDDVGVDAPDTLGDLRDIGKFQ